jgi:hypothetical protein
MPDTRVSIEINRWIEAKIKLPSLVDGYVNPNGRVALAGRDAFPATESWWRDKPILEDIQVFLASYLTSPRATEVPLVILGQPGSGKSVLTRSLAARLPPADFLAVRVELRAVPADTSIQAQIEEAIYQTLGERVSWSELARRAGTAMPVVLLDGFDELLQATGMNRADFLEQAREFQIRESELGRPCAVIITSRTVVADRVRFPEDTPVLRLEPFSDAQILSWLAMWNSTNAGGIAARGLRPLSADAVLTQRHLAEQPLLLLLLALYDAIGNALQIGPSLDSATLYDELFREFAAREVDKHDTWRDESLRSEAVDRELRRLSTVAVAMFNRGTDVIAEQALASDLRHLLLPDDITTSGTAGNSRALTPAQLLVGRFFFVHESTAHRDTSDVERSFEFLHATFGEFLAARLIVDTLVDAAEEWSQSLRRRRATYDPGYFHALTSFATVVRRAPLREFCRSMLEKLPKKKRQDCRELVLELLPEAGFPNSRWSYQEYEPSRKSVTARCANFAANLVWLAVALSDDPVQIADLVGEPALERWQRLGLLFFSQLENEDRQNLWLSLRMEWRSPGILDLRHEDGSDVPVYGSIPWPPDEPRFEIGPLAPEVLVPADSKAGLALRRSAFAQTGVNVREFLYMLAPYWELCGGSVWLDEATTTTQAAVLFRSLLESPSTEHHLDRLVQVASLHTRPVLAELISAAADHEEAEEALHHYTRTEILAAASELEARLAAVDRVRRRLAW